MDKRGNQKMLLSITIWEMFTIPMIYFGIYIFTANVSGDIDGDISHKPHVSTHTSWNAWIAYLMYTWQSKNKFKRLQRIVNTRITSKQKYSPTMQSFRWLWCNDINSAKTTFQRHLCVITVCLLLIKWASKLCFINIPTFSFCNAPNQQANKNIKCI